MYTAEYSSEPSKISYMSLPNGLADVWLRCDIATSDKDTDDGTTYTVWTANEIYFRTAKTEDEISADFDTIFTNGGTGEVFDADTDTVTEVTTSERLDAIELAIMELAEVITNG